MAGGSNSILTTSSGGVKMFINITCLAGGSCHLTLTRFGRGSSSSNIELGRRVELFKHSLSLAGG